MFNLFKKKVKSVPSKSEYSSFTGSEITVYVVWDSIKKPLENVNSLSFHRDAGITTCSIIFNIIKDSNMNELPKNKFHLEIVADNGNHKTTMTVNFLELKTYSFSATVDDIILQETVVLTSTHNIYYFSETYNK